MSVSSASGPSSSWDSLESSIIDSYYSWSSPDLAAVKRNPSTDSIPIISHSKSQPSLAEMMKTFNHRESPHCRDGSDSIISPLSDLSTHFSVTSPISTAIKDSPAALFPIGPSSFEGHKRNASSHSTLPNTGSSAQSNSSFSDDSLDSASSCYSRRSSLTSLGSEYSGCYKSADAFSISNPVAAGVFDDSASVRHAPTRSKTIKKKPSIAQVKNKPLPLEPPIQLTPLTVRPKKTPPPLQLRGRSSSSTSEDSDTMPIAIPRRSPGNKQRHNRTFSQAADDLEDVLAQISVQQPFRVLDAPLQISRGNGDMIATRPAPRPPVSQRPQKSPPSSKFLSGADDMKQFKKSKSSKMPFSFFSRKQDRHHKHVRSMSSTLADVEASKPQDIMEVSREMEADDTIAELPGSETMPRPSSWGSEREMRQKLPRLQTKKTEQPTSPGFTEQTIKKDQRNSTESKKLPKDHENVFEEKIFISTSRPSRRASTRYALPYQMGPIQLPGMIYELDAGPPVTAPAGAGAARATRPVSLGYLPKNVPEKVVLMILESANSLDDLFNLAVVNRQFYKVFKQKELYLIKQTVFKMSPPAWELREMSPPWNSEWQVLLDPDAQVPEYTPTLYLRRYAQDIYTLAQLKSLILARCNTFLRQDTIRGLAGLDIDRAAEIDDAFWRIWTFCRIFGCAKGRENDIMGQVDWLNGGVLAMNPQNSTIVSVAETFGMNNVLFEPPAGFGKGNSGGLSQQQLYDMTEIWTCLSVLLQPVHEKHAEARRVGIFDGFDIRQGDSPREESVLEEWTAYALTLGLSAALCLSSICPIVNASEVFQKAQAVGMTKWEPCEPGTSRSSFLKEALSKAYRERDAVVLPQQQQTAFSDYGSWSRSSSSQGSRSSASSYDSELRQRQNALADEIRNQRPQQLQLRPPGPTSFSDERPISNYSVIMNNLDGRSHQQKYPPLPTPRMQGSHLTPIYQAPLHNPYFVAPPVMPICPPQVLDPVDRAIDMMVHELGFQEKDAKWALKITDTGEGIDVNAAVALLYTEYRKRQHKQRFSRKQRRDTLLTPAAAQNTSTNWKWA
ncbi:hypothetical protein ASPWEDRAFT_24331 [Aspergillus wentii DTO 134E9]|uniref:F-box domain-containing protein n=1 Tax=Aspergillus wentii DTO 134E9 TaxID=1073089 RepID=A0A1L9RTW2_ASPWE|nr:uncharacterized protein ASPWEDRAFT_24331 [Aspergillus wentii DTO 134E9]KAI9934026.1 hypothetical protein MW887_005099 [Aspergillus wentii]OJJ38391.1 hypothetical protein ASPWEDRAFT_24331 [Aspergillus wentii DTO 134E9]